MLVHGCVVPFRVYRLSIAVSMDGLSRFAEFSSRRHWRCSSSDLGQARAESTLQLAISIELLGRTTRASELTGCGLRVRNGRVPGITSARMERNGSFISGGREETTGIIVAVRM